MRGKTILLASGLVFAIGAVGLTAAEAFHFALSKSAPVADASVPTPEAVKLWFTEEPQTNSLGIRLIRDGARVATSAPTVDEEDALAYFVTPAAPLAPGPYTVSWRGIGSDGHVVTGEFAFSVTAQ